MTLIIKPGVRVHGISNEIILTIATAKDVIGQYADDTVITSCIDGRHSPGSLHYSGDTVDIRSRDIPEQWRQKVRGMFAVATRAFWPALFG